MLKSRVCFSPKEDQETLMLLCILFYLKAVTVELLMQSWLIVFTCMLLLMVSCKKKVYQRMFHSDNCSQGECIP